MKLSIVNFLVLLLFACKDTKDDGAINDASKLVSTFRPAFDEASEISFIDKESSKSLNILIRNNFRLDENEDTFYFKSIMLNEKQVAMIQDAIVSHLDSAIYQKSFDIRDGLWVSYRYIKNNDTIFYELHSPSKASASYEVTLSTLDTYQTIFQDTIISDYFNDLRTYLTHEEYVETKTMTPLKQLREVKYAGLIKYSR